jgi:hypothetical protein
MGWRGRREGSEGVSSGAFFYAAVKALKEKSKNASAADRFMT